MSAPLPPPPLSALEGALLDNLELRGVARSLRAAVLAVVLDVIAEDGGVAGAPGAGASARAAAAAAAAAREPDALLARALVADYLRATGCGAALAVFEVESGAVAGDAMAAPAPQPGTEGGAGREAQLGAIVAASLARRIAGEAVASAASALGGGGGGGNAAAGGPTPPSPARARRAAAGGGGFLEPSIVRAELGLDAAEALAGAGRAAGRAAAARAEPALEALVRRARELRLADATAARSWLRGVRPAAGEEEAEGGGGGGGPGARAGPPGYFRSPPRARAAGGAASDKGFSSAGRAPITFVND